MVNLTTKLKKGELEEGFYYFELDGEIHIAGKGSLEAFYIYPDPNRNSIKSLKVLSLVPSFERLKEFCQAESDLQEAKKEIKQLKQINSVLMSMLNIKERIKYFLKKLKIIKNN